MKCTSGCGPALIVLTIQWNTLGLDVMELVGELLANANDLQNYFCVCHFCFNTTM